MTDAIAQFYQQHLPDGAVKDAILTAKCPFCKTQGGKQQGKIIVFLNRTSFFYGYFRCQSHCVSGGFAPWFARLAGIDIASVPGYKGDNEFIQQDFGYPEKKINTEIIQFQEKLSNDQLTIFSDARIGDQVLQQMEVGYNGRYLVYPYVQLDGNVYSARCVHPENDDDFFWYGDDSFGAGPTGLFNVEDIKRCENGALFLCEGEDNLLTIKQLGFPGVAVSDRQALEKIDAELFSGIQTLFIVLKKNIESEAAARSAASRIGFKVRILKWDTKCPKDYNLLQFATETRADFAGQFGKMILSAKPFSPFTTPKREYEQFCERMSGEAGEEYGSLLSGFSLVDKRLDGIHGINILGGAPKVGKSCFMIQMATEMACRKIPVLYYDFENGRQRIYQRTLIRMCRIESSKMRKGNFSPDEERRYAEGQGTFEKMLRYFRVINDRKVSPELMRRHIDFISHETMSEYTVVVIDSLNKLPFKNLSERRSGIDAWLRQMESIRDELQVSFLVISELSRGGDGSYSGEPHMGVFKGSGDIEYSADNAMVLFPDWDHMQTGEQERVNKLWLVGSREHSPGLVGNYILDFPYWGFREEN